MFRPQQNIFFREEKHDSWQIANDQPRIHNNQIPDDDDDNDNDDDDDNEDDTMMMMMMTMTMTMTMMTI